MSDTVIHHLSLRDFCRSVLERIGVPRDDAKIVADSLVLADLRGVDTHGVLRLPAYVDSFRAGTVRAGVAFDILDEIPGGVRIDGKRAFGQVIAKRAMELAMERAGDAGVACVAVRNGGHIGAHGNVAIMAAEQGMLGFVMTNGRPVLPPPGGKLTAASSTPFAIGCPSGRAFPLVLDMALSVVSRGRILRAIGAGAEIPPDWAIDTSGKPTRDAAEASRGAVLPIGGYKGYGIAVMLSVVAGLMAGTPFGPGAAEEANDRSRPFSQSHVVLAMNIERFMPLEQFLSHAEAFIADLKATPLAEGASEIFVPGEQSYRRWRERLESGVPVSASVAAKLRETGEALGVDFDACAAARPSGEDRAFAYETASA
jgi:LDH2 family malate/lactate/ureidoglycolate dehydrogenase